MNRAQRAHRRRSVVRFLFWTPILAAVSLSMAILTAGAVDMYWVAIVTALVLAGIAFLRMRYTR